MRNVITLLRSGNSLVVDPSIAPVRNLLEPQLSFVAKRILQGKERRMAGTAVELIPYACFVDDFRGRLATTMGFYSRIHSALTTAGYRVEVKDFQPHPRPQDLEPRWDRLFDPSWPITLRHRQDEFLQKVAALVKIRQSGCFDCPTGYGKSFLIGMIGLLYPKLTMDVVSKSVTVLRDRIYPEVCQLLPSVGMIGGGLNSKGRVQLVTADSLQRRDGKADIVIADEVHQLGADRAATGLSRYTNSTNIGLSATHNMRMDNKNLRVEGMFGPVVFEMTYQEAEARGLVVPIEVYWADVIIDINPCAGIANSSIKKKFGIWRNDVRNQIIANDANSYPDDMQRLITCDTIEHVLFLRKMLPDYQILYSEQGMDQDDINYFQGLGVWRPSEPVMTSERRHNITAAFERGTLKKVIATPVLNVGISPKALSILLRADAGNSDIADTQIPGRTSRLGKKVGIVRDYLDQFDEGFRRRAGDRERNYTGHGWKQIKPVRTKRRRGDGEQMNLGF